MGKSGLQTGSILYENWSTYSQ